MTSSTKEIPKTMKRLVVKSPGKDLSTCQIEVETDTPVPIPKSGQVLIKVIASAINPSDYGSWFRCKPEQCPYAMGKEGSGIVVQLGGGMSAYLRSSIKIGTKVGFVNLKNKQGSYSEYVVADLLGGVFAIPETVPVENAASFFVNPYTAIAILDTVKQQHGSTSFVHTAAASQLGQMIVKLSLLEGVDVINVVRREEQAELLKSIGAKHVIVTTNDDESWKDELKIKMKELNTTVAFDAVSGQSTGDMIDCLPKNGICFLYGGLAGKVTNINPMDLIYYNKKIEGWLLTKWLGSNISMIPKLYSATNKVMSGLENDDGWSSSQFLDTTLENAHKDLIDLVGSNKSTGKKLRIRISAP